MQDKTNLTGLLHEELEPRLLFSAGVETVLLDDDSTSMEATIVDTVVDTDTVILELEQIQQDNKQSGTVHEVVFIDQNVDDYAQLMDDLASKDNIDIYILDSSLDGIDQISAVLEHYQGLDAIHLVSHGNEQGLILGNSSLNNSNIDIYSETIRGWQTALSEQADLLIYGCDLAAGEQGLALLDKLNILTGTDIAASDDKTGQATNGGDWVLEFNQGNIETDIVFSAQLQSNWQGELAAPVISNLGGDVLNYNENDGAVVIDQMTSVAVSDGGAMNDFSTGSLTVGIFPPVDITEDVLSIRNQGSGAGQIGFDGLNVSYEGTNIGMANIGGGSNGIDLIITFSGSPSETAVAALIQNITYENTDTIAPTMGARTVQFTLFNNMVLFDSQSTTVNVSQINDAPTAANNTVTTNEDSSYTFTAADFNYSDVEADPMASVKVTALESAGSLQLNGVDVSLNQVISKADLDAGNLKFVPLADANGIAYDSFGFAVNDGTTNSLSSYTMSIDVIPQNDLPTAAAGPVSTSIDTPYVFSANDFNFSDIDGDAMASIKVTALESVGSLQLNGVDVTLNQVISRADIDAGKLSFTPIPGASGTAYDNFSFSVNDGSSDSASSYTLTINVDTLPGPIATTITPPSTTNPSSLEPTVDTTSTTVTPMEQPDQDLEPQWPETAQKPVMSKDPDIVLDIDIQGKPTVLSLQGDNSLLQPLLNQQSGSDADKSRQLSSAKLDDGASILIESVSPWQVSASNHLVDLQMTLEELNRQLGDNGQAEQVNDRIIITTAVGISIGITAGFAGWLMQGGSLLTALLTSLPTWHNLDPLPILDADKKRKHIKHEKKQQDDVDFVFDRLSASI